MFQSVYNVFAGKPFEFYSTYTFDEAIDLLENQSESKSKDPDGWKRSRPNLTISLECKNDNTYQFTFEQEMPKNIHTIATGEVLHDQAGTCIKGESRIAVSILGWTVFLVVLTVATLFLSLTERIVITHPDNLLVAVLTIVFLMIMTGFLLTLSHKRQNAMCHHIYDLLGRSPKEEKRPA